MMLKKNKELWIIGLAFVVGGLILLTISLFLVCQQQAFLSQSVITTGTITELKEYRSQKNSLTYCAVGQFKAADGEKYKFESDFCSYPPSFEVGDTVSVLYHPDRPQEAQINSFWSLWFVSIFLFAMGFLFGSIGILLISIALKLALKRRTLRNTRNRGD